MSQLEKISSNQVKLTIEVSAEQFAHAIEHVYPEVAKDAKIDGFRPGKAPMNLYIKHYGYSALYEHAIDHAINDTYRDAVMEHDLMVVDYPKVDINEIENISHDKGFTYTALVYVLPEVELVQYKGLAFEALSKKVLKKDVDAAINSALNNKAENVLIDSPAKLSDTVVIDFEGFIDGVAFEGGKAENYELTLGSGAFIPGFEDQLIGSVAEEEREVKVKFPENYHAELAGKDATFKVKVHEVKQRVVPVLDDEFVADLEIEGVKTVEEYRTYTENNLKKAKEKEYEDDYLDKLLKALVEANPIDVPEVMIDNQAKDIEERYRKQAEQYKIPFDMFLQFQGLTEEQFKEHAKLQAANQIKIDLIFEAIIKKENFPVKEEEIEKLYQEIADGNKVMLEQAKKGVRLDDVKYHLQRDEALEFLKKNNGPKFLKDNKEETK